MIKFITTSTTLTPDFDMGEDGKTGSPLARDVYSFRFYYYDNGATDYDYKNVGSVIPFILPKLACYKSHRGLHSWLLYCIYKT